MALPENFYIPSSASIQGKKPKWRCETCGKPFGEQEFRGFVAHASGCADEHYEELRGEKLEVRAPGLYGPDTVDWELERWINDPVNNAAVREGRKRLS